MEIKLKTACDLLKKYVWDKTNGKCYYCGKDLSIKKDVLSRNDFTIDHMISKNVGGSDDLENLVPACLSCNASKEARGVEALRYTMGFKQSGIKEKYNISFTYRQYLALKDIGLDLPIPYVKFYFEKI